MKLTIGSISESLEDYLEIIFLLCREKQVARVKDIALRKQVSMGSVVPALKRLQREGLIEYESRAHVSLTQEGEELALNVISRHEFVANFLVSVLGVPAEAAEKDACSFEHHMSSETFSKIVGFFDFVENCGTDIREQFKTFSRNSGNRHRWQRRYGAVRTLVDLLPGQSGRISCLRAGSAIRQRLIDMGVLPRVEVTMERVAPLGDPIEEKIRGYHLTLRKEEAQSIILENQ
jgi:DtxR family transcriptional regulator, Mn-dependent transcriptional regulator